MKNLCAIALALFVLPSCFWNSTSDTQKSAAAQPLYVVNVLSPELYKDAHIKGSINIDLDDLDDVANKWDKNTPVVFYCSNYQCSASGHAAQQFKKAGFKQVYAYEGGTAEWYQLGKKDSSYILEGSATESYLAHEVAAPDHTQEDVEIITAPELKEMMQHAGLL